MKPARSASRSAAGRLLAASLVAAPWTAGAAALQALPASRAALDRQDLVHSFTISYRGFGPVTARSSFRPAAGYQIRFEGCFARQGDEAICAFTLRAQDAIAISNVDNLSHGSAADGATRRTCCLFVQGDDRGYPIAAGAGAAPGAATYRQTLAPGQQLALMLRVPDYKKGAALAAITFSRGQGDPGVTFPARVKQIP